MSRSKRSVLLVTILLFTILLALENSTLRASAQLNNHNINYTVKKGDTFYSLGLRFNSSVKGIIALNPKIDPSNLRIGSNVKIPVGPHIMIHLVKKGDTLYKIAKKHNIPINMITEKNNIVNPNLIYVGDVLAIHEIMNELSHISGAWRDKGRNEYHITKANIVPTGYNTFNIEMSYLRLHPTYGMLRDYQLSGKGEIKNNEIKFDILHPEFDSVNTKGVITINNGVIQINFITDNKPTDNIFLMSFQEEFTRED